MDAYVVPQRGDGGLQKLSALGGCVDRVLGDMDVRGT